MENERLDFDGIIARLEEEIEKRAAARERSRLRLRDRTLPYRTKEARRAQNRDWLSRNRDYEIERCRLKRLWRDKGEITREEYLLRKAEAYQRAHQKYADEIIRSRCFASRARELSANG